MKIKLVLLSSLIASMFIIKGCMNHNASMPTESEFAQNMELWVGYDMKKYIQKNGYPSSSFTSPSGDKIYVYTDSEPKTNPAYTHYSSYAKFYKDTHTSRGKHREACCKWWIFVDNNDVIKHTESRSKNCT